MRVDTWGNHPLGLHGQAAGRCSHERLYDTGGHVAVFVQRKANISCVLNKPFLNEQQMKETGERVTDVYTTPTRLQRCRNIEGSAVSVHSVLAAFVGQTGRNDIPEMVCVSFNGHRRTERSFLESFTTISCASNESSAKVKVPADFADNEEFKGSKILLTLP